PELIAEFQNAGSVIAELFEAREFGKAMRQIMALADKANQYIAEKQPWVLARDESQAAEVQRVCSLGLNLFRILVIYLKPVVPALAEKVEAFLRVPAFQWQDAATLLTAHRIETFQPLMSRVD